MKKSNIIIIMVGLLLLIAINLFLFTSYEAMEGIITIENTIGNMIISSLFAIAVTIILLYINSKNTKTKAIVIGWIFIFLLLIAWTDEIYSGSLAAINLQYGIWILFTIASVAVFLYLNKSNTN